MSSDLVTFLICVVLAFPVGAFIGFSIARSSRNKGDK